MKSIRSSYLASAAMAALLALPGVALAQSTIGARAGHAAARRHGFTD